MSPPARAPPHGLPSPQLFIPSFTGSLMADSGIACVTSIIDIPFERSLYVGNMLSGILYGENTPLQTKGKQSFRLHLTHETRRQDWIFSHSSPLYIASPIVPPFIAKAKPST